MQVLSNLVQVTVVTVLICLIVKVNGIPQADHTEINWEKNLEDVSKKLQDWRDETSKYYGDVSTSVSSSAKSPWDATVEALDNTGKKIKEFGIDIKEGSTKLYNDLVQTQSGAQSAIFNLYSLLTLIVVAYTFN